MNSKPQNFAGILDARTEQLTINDSAITWNTRKEASMPPSSQCGERCKPGEIYSYLKNSCCWECRLVIFYINLC